MKLRGITDERMRTVVERTLDSPEWEFVGFSGTTHGVVRHIPTGQIVGFGTTPRPGSFKTFAAKIRKISGLVVWRQASRRPGRRRTAKEAPESARLRRDRFAAEADERARRAADARATAEADRRRRDITRLMHPGR